MDWLRGWGGPPTPPLGSSDLLLRGFWLDAMVFFMLGGILMILRMKAVRRCLSQTGFLSILAFHQKFMSPALTFLGMEKGLFDEPDACLAVLC